ncbi:MAG TPA: hypothetical protein VFN30_11730, partial [Chitinophagaceae bacterium]|nr:hypothetical protein [Chitinophagaceae bacterium]
MSTIKYILSPYYRESDSFILKNFVAHILRTYFITLIGIIFCGIFLLTIDPLISKLLNTASITQGFRNADKTLISEYGNLSFLVIC